jgi:polysaccharide export outer membrane protein
MIKQIFLFLLVAVFAVFAVSSQAREAGDYKINAGDVLDIFVWNEETLSREVIVRPDGFISLPLAGEFRAGGQTPAQVSAAVTTALKEFLNDDPVVTVSLRAMNGNIIYVLGKVNRPGAFPVVTQVDVAQALAWAGGLNTFADENDIQVLRRLADGSQQAMEFNYGQVKSGKKLESNIVLKSGDVVVVP